jgi:hypothetical protein|nr:MAG TPA: hypothetical protein [Caudoviricetes sp.]
MAQQSLIAPKDRPGNVNFQKVYNRAKDKDVAVVMLKVDGTTLCMDDHHALTAEEVRDCCEQGCVVQVSGGFYRPVYWKEAGGVATVVCLDNSGTSGALAAKVFTSYQAS